MNEKFVAMLKQLEARLEDPAWLEESRYLTYDLDDAIYASGKFERKEMHLEEQCIVVEVEWLGDGTSLAHILKDFWAMYGRAAEAVQFVWHSVEINFVTFHIVCGSMQENAHGHLVILSISGPNVERVIQDYRAIQEQLDGQE